MGGSGVVVDMAVLHFLAGWCGWHVSLSRLGAAETALLSNFCWNAVWTFSPAAAARRQPAQIAWRLLRFHAICGAGIGLAVLLLHLFHVTLGVNLYIANLLAIGLVTLWNFGLNARFNWGKGGAASHHCCAAWNGVNVVRERRFRPGADRGDLRRGEAVSGGVQGRTCTR